MSARVSVVIPAFNAERFLEAAIRSVLDQTAPAAEVIVVNDGSTDGTAALIESIPGVLGLAQANGGVSVARNTGVARASGDFLAFLDADDYWTTDKLERQLACLAADPAIDLAFCHQLLRLETGAEVPRGYRHPTEGADPSYVPSAWLVRRAAYDRVGAWDPAYRYSQDTDWLARAKDAGLVTHLMPEVLVYKRVHPGNLSGQAAMLQRDMFGLLRSSVARKREARS